MVGAKKGIANTIKNDTNLVFSCPNLYCKGTSVLKYTDTINTEIAIDINLGIGKLS